MNLGYFYFKVEIMAKYRYFFFALAIFIVGCKPTQPIINNGKDLGAKDNNGNTDTVKNLVAVDPEVGDFRITYNLENAYEEFGAPKIIDKVDESTKTVKNPNITSKEHINDPLEKKLSQIRYLNNDIEKTMGYRILIYSGSNINKAKEYNSDLRVALSGTGQSTNLTYEAPNYIVKAGRFISKLKAHKLFTELKKEFPRAIVITEEININRSAFEID